MSWQKLVFQIQKNRIMTSEEDLKWMSLISCSVKFGGTIISRLRPLLLGAIQIIRDIQEEGVNKVSHKLSLLFEVLF